MSMSALLLRLLLLLLLRMLLFLLQLLFLLLVRFIWLLLLLVSRNTALCHAIPPFRALPPRLPPATATATTNAVIILKVAMLAERWDGMVVGRWDDIAVGRNAGMTVGR